MNEKSLLIEKYCSEAFLLFSSEISESDWGDKDAARRYLDKYWLDEKEFRDNWKSLQDKMFINQEEGLPEFIFSPSLRFMALRGGITFEEEDFKQLQSCMKILGDKHIIIVQNSILPAKVPPFKMIYPVDITWDELMSGNFISTALFEMSLNEYFVFSESGKWCKYAANDFDLPLNLIACRPEHESVFRQEIEQSEDECQEIKGWLPPKYSESPNFIER